MVCVFWWWGFGARVAGSSVLWGRQRRVQRGAKNLLFARGPPISWKKSFPHVRRDCEDRPGRYDMNVQMRTSFSMWAGGRALSRSRTAQPQDRRHFSCRFLWSPFGKWASWPRIAKYSLRSEEWLAKRDSTEPCARWDSIFGGEAPFCCVVVSYLLYTCHRTSSIFSGESPLLPHIRGFLSRRCRLNENRRFIQ